MRLWKVLDSERRSMVSGTRYQYPEDGVWTGHCRKPIALCFRGFHYCEGKQVLAWLREGLLAEVEPCAKHEPLHASNKAVSCQLRVVRTFTLDARVLRLFACDCAERALLTERKRGREPDPRSWEAVRIARLYAEGKATKVELNAYAAAATAAYAAAAAATTTAAAAYAATATATYAATTTTYAATYAAIYAADAAAARSRERTWQYRRLLKLTEAGEP